MASWLVRSTPVPWPGTLRCLRQDTLLSRCLSPPRCAMDWHPIQGGVEIFLVASCHGNRDKLRPDGPLGSYADFTYKVFCPLATRYFW